MLSRRFGGKEHITIFESLVEIRKQEKVDDYIQEFEMLVSQTPQTFEDQLLGYFFARLQSNTRNQIRPHDPKDLIRAIQIAQDVEEAMQESRPTGGFPV